MHAFHVMLGIVLGKVCLKRKKPASFARYALTIGVLLEDRSLRALLATYVTLAFLTRLVEARELCSQGISARTGDAH